MSETETALRFWAKVEKTPACWLWQGASANGYGKFWVQGRMTQAHRWAYEDAFGLIPLGLILDHLCRTVSCVRPDHLEPVTHQENMHRGRFGQAAHCPQGHPYDSLNTYRNPHTGERHCRTCRQEKQPVYRQRYAAKIASK